MLRAAKGEPRDKDARYRHEEHIIHNALGGKLSSYDVLCEACGNSVNTSIDSSFVKLFAVYTQQMQHLIDRERVRKSPDGVKGFHSGLQMTIEFKDGLFVPREPYYAVDEKRMELHIYASKGAIKHFEKHAIKETDIKYGSGALKVCLHEYFESSPEIELFFSKGNNDFNEQLSRGIIKIAVEYAYENGVERDALVHLIDEKNFTFYKSDIVFPFVPVSAGHHVLEYFRPILDREYPSHIVMLFTVTHANGLKQLWSYVELFGTFQYYVLLNDDYSGEAVSAAYAQRLKRRTANLEGMDYKELYSFAREHGLNENADPNIGADEDKLRNSLQKQYDRKREAYEYDLQSSITDQLRLLLAQLMFSLHGVETIAAQPEIKEHFAKMTSAELELLQGQLGLMGFQPENVLANYRQLIIQYGEKPILESMPLKVAEYFHDQGDTSREYSFHKVEELMFFIYVNSVKKNGNQQSK